MKIFGDQQRRFSEWWEGEVPSDFVYEVTIRELAELAWQASIESNAPSQQAPTRAEFDALARMVAKNGERWMSSCKRSNCEGIVHHTKRMPYGRCDSCGERSECCS